MTPCLDQLEAEIDALLLDIIQVSELDVVDHQLFKQLNDRLYHLKIKYSKLCQG